MLKLILLPFMLAAIIGFISSLIVHIAALLGWEAPPQAFGLHVGIFVVSIPASIAYTAIHPRHLHSWGWNDQFIGCPAWMRYVAYGLFVYAFINFFGGLTGFTIGGASPMRLFSGHWMVFYWFAFAMFYSLLHYQAQHHCLAGHVVPASARYCERCGQPVVE